MIGDLIGQSLLTVVDKNAFRNLVRTAKGAAEAVGKLRTEIKTSIDTLNSTITKVYSRINGLVDAEFAGYGRLSFRESEILEDADQICRDRYTKWIEGKLSEGAAEVAKIVTTRIDNIIASGYDAAGNLVKRWVVPKGFDSVDHFLLKVDNVTIRNYGYNSIDEFKNVVENTNKYLNANNTNTIINQSLAGSVHENGLK